MFIFVFNGCVLWGPMHFNYISHQNINWFTTCPNSKWLEMSMIKRVIIIEIIELLIGMNMLSLVFWNNFHVLGIVWNIMLWWITPKLDTACTTHWPPGKTDQKLADIFISLGEKFSGLYLIDSASPNRNHMTSLCPTWLAQDGSWWNRPN